MNLTPAPTETQSGTTPPPTDITPVLDFYNRECSGLTLPEYLSKKVGDIYHINRPELEILIRRAIAEYEEANSIAFITLTPSGTYYTVSSVVTAATGNEGDEYRMLEEGEMIQDGDEVHRANGWGVVTIAAGTHLEKAWIGEYRRRLTPNEAQPGTPTP